MLRGCVACSAIGCIMVGECGRLRGCVLLRQDESDGDGRIVY